MPDEPAILLENVSFAYPPVLPDGAPVRVLDGLHLAVRPGEFIGLIGPNGAGKTTLLLIMAGLAPRLTKGRLSGTVRVQGRAGMVFQETDSQLFSATVEAEIAWGMENLGLPVAEIERRLDWALEAMDIAALREAVPGMLSGGQQKRVALAAALAMHPDVLLLDEPTSGLDPIGQDDVLAALADLRRAHPMTVIMAENEAEAIVACAERALVLHEGRITRDAPPRDLFREIAYLDSIGAPIPPAARLADMLRGRGRAADFLTLDEASQALK